MVSGFFVGIFLQEQGLVFITRLPSQKGGEWLPPLGIKEKIGCKEHSIGSFLSQYG
jgi:hypothetical protein